ncbi:MAG: hypothetical protein H6595_03890 [Flavobacteriales bacterium]|nr:hypothetical protein [Flavobacteriales bacterium]MCB9166602.1 hypothetical protein [Flavobacteriales bacterium]
MEFLSPRVSIERSKDRLSVVISARLPKWQETLLVAWFLAWLLSGGYIFYSYLHLPHGGLRQYLLVFLAFWAYFALRIGKAVAWRLKGFESWRLKGGVFTLKNSIFGLGKARDHFVENIQDLGPLGRNERSLKWQINESFWVIGGERLVFTDRGRKFGFGKGLNDKEVGALLPLLEHAMHRERGRAEQPAGQP